MISNQFHTTIKILRSDNGGEYTSTNFTNHLAHKGILHQFSCPHTPEQNGTVERKNRHITETARTLLAHAHLPNQFWLEAVNTATYLINRLPTKTLDMSSPYFKLYKHQPSYDHLRTFGCLCFPWTAFNRKHKLQPKSSPHILLGYSTNQKGYRCYDPNTKRLIISRHVRFHETDFPYQTTSPTHPPNTHNTYTPPSLLQPIRLSTTTQKPPNSNQIPPPPPSTKPNLLEPFPQHYHRRPKTSTTTQPPINHPNIPTPHINPIMNLIHTKTEPTSYKQALLNPSWK